MLALKKKREAEAKAKAAAAAAAPPSSEPAPMAVDSTSSSSNKVSLLGIGGKKKKSEDGAAKNGTKKRSPGEIRIQKGECCYCCGVALFISFIVSFELVCKVGVIGATKLIALIS